jgi:cytochrome P450
VQFQLGPHRAFLVNDPTLVHDLVVTNGKKVNKGPFFESMRPVLGDGLATSEEPTHMPRRRLAQPAFHHRKIAGYVTIMSDSTMEAIATWREGQRVELNIELQALAMTIVARSLFSADIGRDAVEESLRSFPTIVEGIPKRTTSPLPFLSKLPTPDNLRFNAATKRLHAVIERIIAEYRASGIDHGDLVSMLIDARDDGQGLDDIAIRDEVLTMYAAGYETVSGTMGFAFHALGEHPEIRARLEEEVDRVLAGRPVTMEDVGELMYTRRVMQETLRRYNPVWMGMRQATEEFILGEATIPEGGVIMYSPYTQENDPKYFANPEVFDPDRWLPEHADAIGKYDYRPFGMGNRSCIGEPFAWAEGVVILATIAQRFGMEPVPGEIVEERPLAALRVSQLPMTVRERPRALTPA